MDTQKKCKKHEINTKTQKLENSDNHKKEKRKLEKSKTHNRLPRKGKRKRKLEKSKTHNRLPRKGKRKRNEEHTSKKNATQIGRRKSPEQNRNGHKSKRRGRNIEQ